MLIPKFPIMGAHKKDILLAVSPLWCGSVQCSVIRIKPIRPAAAQSQINSSFLALVYNRTLGNLLTTVCGRWSNHVFYVKKPGAILD